MRVTFFTDGIHPYVLGGMQSYALNLTRYLLRNGVEVDLYHFRKQHQEMPLSELFASEELERLNVFESSFPSFTRIPGHYLRESKAYSKQLFELWQQNNRATDFVLSHGFTAWHYLSQQAKGVSLPPCGISYHGLNMFQPASSKLAELQMRSMRKPVLEHAKQAQVVFTFGGRIREIFEQRGISSSKLVNITNALGEDWLHQQIEPKNASKRTFLFVGRYDKLKGIELLVDTLKQLEQLTTAFEFHFVGDLPTHVHFNSPRLKYHGAMIGDDLKQLMQQCDVMVLPSYSEGMPTVLLEAMASGMTCVATNVGAVEEQLSSENGWLIEPRNQKQLLETLHTIIQLDDSELMRKKQQSLIDVREKFSWDSAVQPYLQALNQTYS